MLLKKLFKPSIKIKKTGYFYLVILLMVVFFIASYVHNNNIGYIGLFFLFSISFVSVIMGRVNIKKADYKLLKNRIFAGEQIKLKFEKKGNFTAEINDEFVFKRGINRFKTVIKSDYPLGLVVFYKEKEFEILVYPQLKGETLFEGFGDEKTEFSGLKKYNYDELKYIHWPSFAKGDLQVKVFEGEGGSRNRVFDYSKISGTKEERISQLALWAYEAFNKNLDFIILLPDKKIESKEGFDEVFKQLALY